MMLNKVDVLSRIRDSEEARFRDLTTEEKREILKKESRCLKEMGINIRSSWYGKITGIKSRVYGSDELKENDVILIREQGAEYIPFIVLIDNHEKVLERLDKDRSKYKVRSEEVYTIYDTFKVRVDVGARKSVADFVLALICIAVAYCLKMPQYKLTYIALQLSAIALMIKSNYIRN